MGQQNAAGKALHPVASSRKGRAAGRWSALLRDTLEATTDGILVVDRQDVVVTHNARFRELWRIPDALACCKSNQTLIRQVLPQLCDPEVFVETIQHNQAHPEGSYFLSLRFEDGRVLERFSRPQRRGDQIVGRVLAFRDVSERQRLLAQAEEAVRLRDRYLSMAAHEIRGPLTSLRLAVQTLRSGLVPAEAIPQSLDIIDRSQRRVADLVERLLDLGRIQSGTLKLQLEPTDLREVVSEVIAQQQDDLKRSGSTVMVRVDEEPVVGSWDRMWLQQIVANLLSNAIKFGSGKPIEVNVSAGPGRGVLQVRDQGIGISRQAQRRIFQAFERAVSLRQYDGLGLGLHIVRTIVEALGGTVEVASDPGAGATFRAELPLTPDPWPLPT